MFVSSVAREASERADQRGAVAVSTNHESHPMGGNAPTAGTAGGSLSRKVPSPLPSPLTTDSTVAAANTMGAVRPVMFAGLTCVWSASARNRRRVACG